jgi:hypothetical protein
MGNSNLPSRVPETARCAQCGVEYADHRSRPPHPRPEAGCPAFLTRFSAVPSRTLDETAPPKSVPAPPEKISEFRLKFGTRS